MPYLYLVSLGCSKNQVDTEAMLGRLVPRGFNVCGKPEDADVLLVNTCAFIEPAREESLSVIRECAAVKQPGQKLVVCGCLTHVADEELRSRLPAVDAWLSIQEEQAVFERLSKWFPGDATAAARERIRLSPPHYAYLRVADGCNHQCSFCSIPGIRGCYRSRLPDEIIEEAARLADEGVVELNIIAQDTSGYGLDLGRHETLPDLLRRLCAIDGIQWIRLQYLYPATITGELLDLIAAREKLCAYLDMPLQHIADPVLTHMRRPGKTFTLKLLETIRNRLPECTLRTAMIVGYPSETEAAFTELYDFVAEKHFDHLGVFEYSHEKGTAAFTEPDRIPAAEKRARREALMRLQQKITLEKNVQAVGETELVLLDEVAGTTAVGRRRGDAPEVDNSVHIRKAGQFPPGSIIPVRINRAGPYDLYGTAETGWLACK